MSIRRIRPDEGSRLRRLRLEALRSDPLAFGRTLAQARAMRPEQWRTQARQGSRGGEALTLAAVLPGGRWVGLAGLFTHEGKYVLWGMWVAPGYRERGLGRALVERLLLWSERRTTRRPVLLEVNPVQASAVRLYTRLGFRATGRSRPLGHHPPHRAREMRWRGRSPSPTPASGRSSRRSAPRRR